MFVNGQPVHPDEIISKAGPYSLTIQTLEQSYLGVKLPIELERWIVQNNEIW